MIVGLWLSLVRFLHFPLQKSQKKRREKKTGLLFDCVYGGVNSRPQFCGLLISITGFSSCVRFAFLFYFHCY